MWGERRMFDWFLLYYAKVIVIQLYHGSDIMYEMRRGKSLPTLLPIHGNFNLPHYIGMAGEELAFDDAVIYI